MQLQSPRKSTLSDLTRIRQCESHGSLLVKNNKISDALLLIKASGHIPKLLLLVSAFSRAISYNPAVRQASLNQDLLQAAGLLSSTETQTQHLCNCGSLASREIQLFQGFLTATGHGDFLKGSSPYPPIKDFRLATPPDRTPWGFFGTTYANSQRYPQLELERCSYTKLRREQT